MAAGASFLQDLVRFVPELTSLYQDHLLQNDTLLPHVFMADLSRFARTEILSTRRRSTVIKLLNYLESGLCAGDKDIRELIVASFVENLIGETDTLFAMKPLMGPNLRREVIVICG